MRLCRGVVAAVLVLGIGAPRAAHGQYVEGRVSVMLAGGYTGIVTDAPSPLGVPLSGPSMTLTPMSALLVETARTKNFLSYSFSLAVPLNGQPVSHVNRLDYTGEYALDGYTNMRLVLGGSESPINSLIVAQNPAQSPLEAMPPGFNRLFGGALREMVTRQLSPRHSLTQSMSLAVAIPIEASIDDTKPQPTLPRTLAVTNGLALNWLFPRDVVSIGLEVAVTRFTTALGGPEGTTVMTPAYTQMLDSLVVGWVRALSEEFSLSATAGAVHAMNPDQPAQQRAQPTATMSLNYAHGKGVAVLAYSHQAAVNLSAAATNFVDEVQARAVRPIGTSGFTTSGAVGFAHATTLTYDGKLAPPVNVAMFDVGVDWVPPKVPTIAIGLRGQVQRQWAAGQMATENMPNLMTNFSRYAASLSFTWSYPSAASALQPPNLFLHQGPLPEAQQARPLGEGSYDEGILGKPGPSDD